MNAQKGYRCYGCGLIYTHRISAQTCCCPEQFWICGKCAEWYGSKERAEACCEEKEEPRWIDPNQQNLFEEEGEAK